MQADEYIYLLIPTFFKVSTRAITQRSTFSPSHSSSNHYRFSTHPLNESIILSFIEKEEKVDASIVRARGMGAEGKKSERKMQPIN